MAAVTIRGSAASTSSSTTGAVEVDPFMVAATFTLKVTAAATDAGDTFDLYVQSSDDAGTTWNDFIHFTQVLGNGGAKTFVAKWVGVITPTTALAAPGDAALAAGVAQGPIGSHIRAKWVIVDGGTTNASFTWSLVMSPVLSGETQRR